MRLLSGPQGKSRKELENINQEIRSLELDGVIKSKRKEISDLDRELVSSLSQIGSERYEEEKQWKEKIRILTEEVDNLERRKSIALVPLEKREQEVETKDSVLSRREENILIKESDMERTREILQDRLDAISEREQDATDYSVKLNSREFAIQFQEKEIQGRMAALTEILKESLSDILIAQTEEARRKAVLKGRDVSIKEREEHVRQQEASFANREKAIVDRYKTLQRAIAEINLRK